MKHRRSAIHSAYTRICTIFCAFVTIGISSSTSAQTKYSPFDKALLDVESLLTDAVAPKPKDSQADPAAAALRSAALTGVGALLKNMSDVHRQMAAVPKLAKAGLANPDLLFAMAVVPAFNRANAELDRAAYCFAFNDRVVAMGTIGLDGRLYSATIDGRTWEGPTTTTLNSAGQRVSPCTPFINAYGRWLGTLRAMSERDVTQSTSKQ